MAPRRGARCVKTANTINYADISLDKVLCPICRYILIKPVTLPCSHDFCETCFEGTLANANLTCPLCRVRFGSWHRIAKKGNRVLNTLLWETVQRKFPKQVENRLNGIDENLETEISIPRISTAGEIRHEYELQKRKQDLDRHNRIEAEEKASAELIKQLEEQEEYEALLREEKLRLDEQVARQIAKEMGFLSSASKMKEGTGKRRRPLDKFIAGKLNDESNKPVPEYLNNINKGGKEGKTSFCMDFNDSNDSIENECRYFKPIDHRNIPPSKSGNILKVPAKIQKNCTFTIGAPKGNREFSYSLNTAFARFETTSPILGIAATTSSSSSSSASTIVAGAKRKIAPEKTTRSVRKKLDLDAPARLYSAKSRRCSPKKTQVASSPRKSTKRTNSPFRGFERAAGSATHVEKKSKERQVRDDLEYARKLQEEFNKERYSTRSSIICRNNVKKTRQTKLTEILSTPKCK